MTEPAPPAPHPYSSARHPQPRHVSPAESLVWLKAGWSFFMQSPGVWIAIAVIFIVMLFVLGLVPLLGWAVVLIGFPVMVAGMVLGCHAQARGEPLRIEHLFAGLGQNLLRHRGVEVVVAGQAVHELHVGVLGAFE